MRAKKVRRPHDRNPLRQFDAIYLDMDGVLVDFSGSVMAHLGYPRDLIYDPENDSFWGLLKVMAKATGRPWSEEQFWELIAEAGHDFWATLPKLPWADELYALCVETAPTVIMTAPGYHPSSGSGKMEWIAQNLPDARSFAITPCKWHMAFHGALLVDDSSEGCTKFEEHGGTSFLWPQPWSRPGAWKGVDGLKELRALLGR